MTDSENSQTAVNDQRTQAGADTNLTQPRSPAVPNPILTTRNIVGAETPIGHGLSNVNEQNLYRPEYVRQPWATHPLQTPAAAMKWQADRLAALSIPKGDRQ